MKKLTLLFMISFLAFMSCKKDEETTQDPVGATKFETLKNYMVNNDLDLPDVLSGWTLAAPSSVDDLPAFLDAYYFIDIRSADDFAAGHIEGAVNSPLANILTAAASADKPIVVVCYSGQTAGHAVMGLRLSGYSDAKVLLFGMSKWSSATSGSWVNNIGDKAAEFPTSWSTDAAPAVQEFGEPTLTASASDGAGILAERVQLMLDGGLNRITNTDVLTDPSAYFINNYWPATQSDEPTNPYEGYGHVDGAYRILPLSLANGEYKNYDPDKTAVTYCWTGQTSSMVTAYLNVIGYNSVSLLFGVNGMIYSDLLSHKYTAPTVDLPMVTE